MTKWAHLVHHARRGYFFSPCRHSRTPMCLLLPPLENTTEACLQVPKSPTMMGKPTAYGQNSVDKFVEARRRTALKQDK
jgi:hypothetical protein